MRLRAEFHMRRNWFFARYGIFFRGKRIGFHFFEIRKFWRCVARPRDRRRLGRRRQIFASFRLNDCGGRSYHRSFA